MRIRRFVLMPFLLGLLLTGPLVEGKLLPASEPERSPAAEGAAEVTRAFRGAPLMFVQNVGQFDEGARFQLLGGSGTVWLAHDAIWITLLEPAPPNSPADRDPLARLERGSLQAPDDRARPGVNLRLSFAGANPSPTLEPFEPLTTTVSYFLGNDPAGWRPAVPVWGGVRYADLYPGLDLELTGREGELALQMVCRAAGCQDTLESVQLQVEGADEVAIEGDALRIGTAVGDVRPPLLEVVDREGRPVAMGALEPAPAAATVSHPFASSPSPQSQGLGPESPDDDPADLDYSTFLGSGDGLGVAIEGEGYAIVVGSTDSPEFPTTPGAFDPILGGTDAFVTKVNLEGSALVYSTFLGGGSPDSAHAIAVDAAGNAYVTGGTTASDFPTTPGAFDATYNGGVNDAYLAKLNAAGSDLLYSTFLGGGSGGYGADYGTGIAIDSTGSAYVAGVTESDDFPITPGAFDTSHNGGYDTFVAKVNPAGSDLLYSTFLGGSLTDITEGFHNIAVDGAGSAYVTGVTSSFDFPTTPGAFDTDHGIASEGFITKFNPEGSALVYSTFLGGSNHDSAHAIAVDGAGNAYVTGKTSSSDFPTTPGALDTTFNGPAGYTDAFVANLNPAGSDLNFATFLGGGDTDRGLAIAVDGAGGASVTGFTASSDFPTTSGAFDAIYNGSFDTFVARLNSAGSNLIYATFLGGDDSDIGESISVDGTGNVYVVGSTNSGDFPTTPGAFDTTFNGSAGYSDAFVAKFVTASFAFDTFIPVAIRPE